MSTVVLDKKADLAGPGIGDYKELEQVLPRDYRSLLTPKETQQAIFRLKRYIEDNLCKELNLMMARSRLSSTWKVASMTCTIATGRARPSSSTSRTIVTSIRWTLRWCRQPRSGNGSR